MPANRKINWFRYKTEFACACACLCMFTEFPTLYLQQITPTLSQPCQNKLSNPLTFVNISSETIPLSLLPVYLATINPWNVSIALFKTFYASNKYMKSSAHFCLHCLVRYHESQCRRFTQEGKQLFPTLHMDH